MGNGMPGWSSELFLILRHCIGWAAASDGDAGFSAYLRFRCVSMSISNILWICFDSFDAE